MNEQPRVESKTGCKCGEGVYESLLGHGGMGHSLHRTAAAMPSPALTSRGALRRRWQQLRALAEGVQHLQGRGMAPLGLQRQGGAGVARMARGQENVSGHVHNAIIAGSAAHQCSGSTGWQYMQYLVQSHKLRIAPRCLQCRLSCL